MDSEVGPDTNYLGAGARLAAGPSTALAETAFAFELEAAQYLWHHLGRADKAHLAGLVDAGVVSSEQARLIIAAVDEIDGSAQAISSLDPYLGDVHNNRDVLIKERVGQVAGVLNTGRARREATTIAWQIACRERLTALGDATVQLVTVLVDTAEEHVSTIMPDFTYLHHAHPTTLGHYLLGFAYPLVRTLERIDSVFALVDRSPAGSGSVNGSPIPLDRQLIGSLLEFSGLVAHTRDAMWAPDMALQQMNVVVDLGVSIDRLAEDMHIWTTEEFGFVEIADQHSRTSVIMPQKKNPYSLAYLRGSARYATGVASGLTATMLTPTGQPDNRIFSYIEVPRSLDRFTANTLLLADVVASARFDKNRMETSARSGHTYATDLCDFLVMDHGLDNRTAHSIVGAAVRSAIENDLALVSAITITAEANSRGIDIELGEDAVESVADPSTIIAVRDGIGGAAPEPLTAMIREIRDRVEVVAGHLATRDHEGFDDRLNLGVAEILTNKEKR